MYVCNKINAFFLSKNNNKKMIFFCKASNSYKKLINNRVSEYKTNIFNLINLLQKNSASNSETSCFDDNPKYTMVFGVRLDI